MTREQFDTLVQQQSRRAQAAPGRMKLEVGAFAAFGFAYMMGVFLLMSALTLAAIGAIFAAPSGVTIKLGLFLILAAGGVALAIGRGLWVRIDPPEGVRLTAGDAPRLLEFVDDIGKRMQAPVFHEVLIVQDYNAAVVQIPRLGILGWHRNYLLVGLPLMQSLAREEFGAVLAHEFGHLSRSHGRFGNWLYRLRRSWQRVFEELARQNVGKFALPLTVFIEWFWPRFNARAFVLSRENEYEADAAAAQTLSAAALASALIRLQVDGPFLDDRFWPDIFRRAGVQQEPPPDIFHQLALRLTQEREPGDSRRWLEVGFRLETNSSDTHPCLRDRLKALGQLSPEGRPPDVFPTREGPSAAEDLLGPAELDLERRLGERWAKSVTEVWHRRFQEVSELAKRQAESNGAGTPTGSPVEQLWQRAQYALQVESPKSVLPLLEQIVGLDPNHSAALFHRGRILLDSDDPAGVEMLEAAIRSDFMATEPACQLLYGFYIRTGQRDRLKGLELRIEEFRRIHAAAQLERNLVQDIDTFLPTHLEPEPIRVTVALLEAEPEVEAAHLAEKKVQFFPERPCRVLAIDVKRAWWKVVDSDANQKLAQRLAAQVPIPGCLVLVIQKDLRSLGQCIAEVPGSCIYRRAKA